jgi:tetraacyldisaccharide 4'-kinase
MREAVQRAWLRRGPLAWSLLPLSLLFAALSAARGLLYRVGVLRSTRLSVPVVVVGNVVAGGAGKTPVILELLEHLHKRGLRAGVVSRGYGRSTTGCQEVLETSSAADAGDEPLLIRQRSAVPVFVSARRAEAAQALLAAYPRTQVVLSDDGLQHLALARDIEICVFDERGAGNGWLLPAGPLREPWPRPVDLVLRPAACAALPGHGLERRLGPAARRNDGSTTALQDLRGQPVHAVAGIATPEVFFRMLREQGLQLATALALPDHDAFAQPLVLRQLPGPLLCTEKDAVKLWRMRPDAWAVPLELAIAPSFWREFDRLLDAKLSSTHGSQTA